jgi:hypothetical protein
MQLGGIQLLEGAANTTMEHLELGEQQLRCGLMYPGSSGSACKFGKYLGLL